MPRPMPLVLPVIRAVRPASVWSMGTPFLRICGMNAGSKHRSSRIIPLAKISGESFARNRLPSGYGSRFNRPTSRFTEGDSSRGA